MKISPFFWPATACIVASASLSSAGFAAPADYFRINVVDAETNRGVPLVELKVGNDVRYLTDSNGIVAVDDPELMGQKVYFQIKSHGYEIPKDGLGYRGTALQVVAGNQTTIKIKRLNVAERLYRLTGAGIYRDSVLVGAPVPLKNPLMNGLVMGQDTVHATPYKGKIFWLWGDTNQFAYPLGNFFTSSATSLPPGKGGLDPDKGVDYTYWVDENGFSKKMLPMPGNKPVWMGGLFVMPDDKGQERLFGGYAQVISDSKSSELGMAVFNDEKGQFEKLSAFNAALHPDGRPFRATVGNQTYLYWSAHMRSIADYKHATNPALYQAYTCAAPGAKLDGANTPLERDASGKLVYGWKTNTAIVRPEHEQLLIGAGKMTPEEGVYHLRDVENGDAIDPKGGSVYWNPYRNRWVRIVGQAMGSTSVLGEIFFCESDTPVGPWGYARKIITHDAYTFYNTTHHPFFDQNGGKTIYLEGTYTATYSGNQERTPRYDYNQIMYRLNLEDPRLALPIPIYRLKTGALASRETLQGANWVSQVQSAPFFAMPSAGDGKSGLVPVYATHSPQGGTQLQMTAPAGAEARVRAGAGARPLFYALPAVETAPNSKPNPSLAPLYEYRNAASGARFYSTKADESGEGVTRSAQPLMRVWRNFSSSLVLDQLTPQANNSQLNNQHVDN